MDYEEWLAYGIGEKWIVPSVCDTHDGGAPMTLDEEIAFENDRLTTPDVPKSDDEYVELGEGFDPCIHILRLCESPEVHAAVMANAGH